MQHKCYVNSCQFSSVTQSYLTLWLHGLQHMRLLCSRLSVLGKFKFYLLKFSGTFFSQIFLSPIIWIHRYNTFRCGGLTILPGDTPQGYQDHTWEEDSLFNRWYSENWITTWKRMNLDSYLMLNTKINSKWIKDLHYKTRRHRENTSENWI